MAYNSTYTGQRIDEAVRDGEWYNLSCRSAVKSALGFNSLIIIENFVPRLMNAEYRLVFMRKRRVSGKGLKWCIPMFGSIHEPEIGLPIEQTYLPLTGNKMAVAFNTAQWKIVARVDSYDKSCGYFSDTRNTRKRVGYAIFKHTGIGSFGWQRVSNIAGIEAALGNKNPNLKANYSMFCE